jgi:hypothetical protein
VRLTSILVKAGSGVTGIPAVDRFITNKHPAFITRDRQIFLADELARRTSISDSNVLGQLLIKSGAPAVFAKGTTSLSASIQNIRTLADELPSKLANAERTALSALLRDPSDKHLVEWVTKRRACLDAEDAAESLLVAAQQAETDSFSTPEYAAATIAALEKLAAASRKDEHYLGAQIALRCAALVYFVQTTHQEATQLARELLSGRSCEPLPPHLIPSSWVERGTPPGFVWDEMALLPA